MNLEILNYIRRIIYRNSYLLRKNKTSLSKFLQPIKQVLYGGGNRELKVTYNNNTYTFLETHDDNYFVLYSKNEEDCVMVVIQDDIAEIHGLYKNYK